jgi:hypothetical protein
LELKTNKRIRPSGRFPLGLFFPAMVFLAMVSGEGQNNPCPPAVPCVVSTNYSTDLTGIAGVSGNTWGTANHSDWQMAFHPPTGFRVRVLHVRGDFVAGPHGVTPAGTGTYVLFSLMTSGAVASPLADNSSGGCFLEIQGGTNGAIIRLPFDSDVSAGGLLGTDAILVIRAAMFLNDTGLVIHEEPTMVITFDFEGGPG